MEILRLPVSSFVALLLLVRFAFSSAVVVERPNGNLSSAPNATSVINSLRYTANCTAASLWFNNLPLDGTAGSGNNSINSAFLRSALPQEYQDASTDEIAAFYDDMSSGPLSNTAWLGTASDDVQTACIAPQIENKVPLTKLNATQNCTATAEFLSSLGWIGNAQTYASNSQNDTSWVNFIFYALPLEIQENITTVELFVYHDHIMSSATNRDLNNFLQAAYYSCQDDICEVQGYTGNPDIGGIGVLASYTTEAALVTLYFIAVNVENYLYGIRPPPERDPSRLSKAFRSSDDLLDGALFFSLSISSAGWVSFVSGRSYYEKLVFTSANVLALSSLFAFLAMFPRQGLEKRGYILIIMIVGILVESGIQYIVYLTENNNEKYPDYGCLHRRFEIQGYHPAIFEALFFLLAGLSLIGGAIALWYILRHKKEIQIRKELHEELTLVERWAFAARIFTEVVAISIVWVECVYLFKIRYIMAQVAGATWSEGQWGFGQILALFIWFPPLLDILGTLLLPTWMTGKREAEVTEGKNLSNNGVPDTLPVVGKKGVLTSYTSLDPEGLKQRPCQ